MYITWFDLASQTLFFAGLLSAKHVKPIPQKMFANVQAISSTSLPRQKAEKTVRSQEFE